MRAECLIVFVAKQLILEEEDGSLQRLQIVFYNAKHLICVNLEFLSRLEFHISRFAV